MLDHNQANEPLTAGQHLRREMKRRGFDQKRLADEIGVSRQTVNYIVNDHQEISIEVGHALSRLMGLPKDYWLTDHFSTSEGQGSNGTLKGGASLAIAPGVLVDCAIEDAVRSNLISIDPFRKENLKQASLDLTISSRALLGDGEQLELTRGRGYWLEKGEAITLLTQERINLKNQMVGRVGGTTEYVRQGLQVIHGFQIDPAFNDQLQFVVLNFGTKRFEILAGQRILSVELMGLSHVPNQEFDQQDANFEDTVEKRREVNFADVLHRTVWPGLKASIEYSKRQNRFRAVIPSVFEPNTIFPRKIDAEQALSDAVYSRLLAFVSAKEKAGLKDFINKISCESEASLLSYRAACEVCEALGLRLNLDKDAVVAADGSETLLPIEKGNGEISIFDLLCELNLVKLPN
ncbi:dCTP deaminase domain-containing protein [Loktanella sp. Alg231-35]|uniref:dCTP deaminase domain-containing protein n=1 Tax=Loktanella sp. Alg231-35 TaxID=1922220 RepID=UPI000D562853|nr:helix-turn-helix domain-containing protein [Loktanella sp. Alg231-35]